jgi:hypothetical protein
MNGLTHQQTSELCFHLKWIFQGPEHGVCRQSDIERHIIRAVELLESAGYKTSDGYVVELLRKEVHAQDLRDQAHEVD